jgi:formate-dependent nitrite reductase membrane component NrfD
VNESKLTTSGLEGARPGREALPGARRPARQPAGDAGRRRRRGKGSAAAPPDDRPRSYYGLPVLNKPVWQAREIAGYLFLGGLAGASSAVALGADLTGRPALARGAKAGAAGAAVLSLAALIKDLGRPARFLHMLRVFKPTSPMSVGTWILAGYAPAALAAAASDLSGMLPGVGMAATGGAAILGPAVASYTGVLVADTAIPAWHDAYRELPFLFVSSAAAAAAGLGLACAADDESAPVRYLAAVAGGAELAAETLLEHRLEPVVRRAYEQGTAGTLLRAAHVLTVLGVAAAAASARSRPFRFVAAAALLTGSACTRFGVFHAGVASAEDPAATIEPQRARANERGRPGAQA